MELSCGMARVAGLVEPPLRVAEVGEVFGECAEV
jgi:hypothetical protein